MSEEKTECKIVVTIRGTEFVMSRSEVVDLINSLGETVGYRFGFDILPSLPPCPSIDEWYKRLPEPPSKEKLGDVYITNKLILKPVPTIKPYSLSNVVRGYVWENCPSKETEQ